MSITSIASGIITNLSSASCLGSDQVASHYHVLETTSACCAVVQSFGVDYSRQTFNNDREVEHSFAVKLYVKDQSFNSETINNETQSLMDLVASSLWSDPSLQQDTNVCELTRIIFQRDLENLYDAGGNSWYLVEGEITCTEWPDNV